MGDTSLIFNILARSNLSSALTKDAAATKVLGTAFRVLSGGSAADIGRASVALGALGAVGAGVFAGLGVGIAGVGLGIAAIGIKAAAASAQVKTAFTNLANNAKATLQSAAAPMVPVLQNVATQAQGLLAPLGKSLGSAFKALAPALNSLVGSLASGLKPLIGALGPIAKAVAPLIKAIGAGLKPVLGALAGVLTTVAQTAGKFAPQLQQMFNAIGQIVTALGPLLSALIELGAPIIGPLLGLVAGLAGQLSTALSPILAQLGPILGQVLTALMPLVGAIGQLLSAVLPILPPIAQLIGQLVAGLVPALVPIISLIAKLASQLIGILVPAWKAITPVLVTVIGWVSKIAQVILTVLLKAITWLVSKVPAAWQAVKNGVSSAVNGIKAVINWFGNLPGMIGGWFGKMKDAAIRKATELTLWVRGLPKKIMSAVGKLNSLLFNAGKDVLTGLWNGIKSMAGWVKDKVIGLVSDILPGPVKKILGIASPSKVFTWIGKQTVAGLVKGLTSDQDKIKTASKTMADTVMAAWKQKRISTHFASALLGKIAAGNAKLQALAKQRDSILAKIQQAKEFAGNVTSNARSFAAITGIEAPEGQPMTAATISAGIQAKLAAIRRFSAVIKALAKKGLNKTLLQQVIEAGPEQGLILGEALLAADAGSWRAINSAQSAITKASSDLGLISADVMFDSGAKAGQGFLTGLMAQEKSIQAAMDKLAKNLVTSIKKALKIKSPSRVFAEIGTMTGAGLVNGMNASNRGVANAAERMALAATPSVPGPSIRGGAAPVTMSRADRAPQVLIGSDGSKLGDLLVEVLRETINKKGGDPVFVLSGGRRRLA